MRKYVVALCFIFLAACRSAAPTKVEPLPIGRSLDDIYLQEYHTGADEPMESAGVFEEADRSYKLMMVGAPAAGAPPSKIIERVKGKRSWRDMGPTPPSLTPITLPDKPDLINGGVPDPVKKDKVENKSSGCSKIFIFLIPLLFLALPRLSTLLKNLKTKKLDS